MIQSTRMGSVLGSTSTFVSGVTLILTLGTLTPLFGGSAWAAGFDVPVTEHHHKTAKSTSVEVQYAHQFESNTDNRGNVTRDNAIFNLRHRFSLNDNTGFTLLTGYQLSAYDFSGSATPGTGTFQWDDTHEFRAVGLFDYRINERWTLVTGGAVFSNVEGGGDFDEGLTAGGAIGFTYKASENLELGVLVGAASGIEDSVTLFPIPRVDWRFGDGWRWRLDMMTAFGGRGVGTELSYRATKSLEFAIGVTRQRRRFRLDDHGTVNNGVGEESSIPAFVRVGFNPSPNIHLDVRGGVAVKGELRHETRTGARIESDQFDPAPMVGVGGFFAF